ncbi:GGDEF domain-containing protein [Neptuniibacter sp. 1_MG-2023]|uniref:GGDEF domain-containing protein n=1 Tax=Neptuniibacter sp. 1_MG-2023 TaxID=3062662 RepID=UPI0026E20D60|nr:GGDEF domain-containing protein [Neptuniibacter sp. 1_MG-2023]MDO6592458.1 GGDEF domain-containing protein [Neptuniibacter sp. 1_MG-2023]
MKFAENNNQAAEYLRQAIPLMVKHNIPPNPLNYALWYTYVSDRLPELNVQLDKTLTTYGTCPTMLSEQLFREHMIKDEINGAEDIQASLISLINNLYEDAGHTAEKTANFNTVLEESLVTLQQQEDGEASLPLDSIIHALSTHTKSIGDTARLFQERMYAAQIEIQALKEELNKTRQDARVDPLTNLFNRRVFDSELAQLVNSTNNKLISSFILVDIDHFKGFNDTYGHLMGDKVLQYVGKLLKDICPEPMLPVRYGGEEFAVLMPGVNIDSASEIAEKVREKIQAIRIKQKKSGEIISSITASFGVSQFKHGETAEQLIDRTDKALYKAKDSGRNQVKCAN